MKRQGMAFLAAGMLVVGALACFKDPVESLQGSASRVSLSKRFLQQNVGDTDVVNIQVLDAQGNPLPLTGVTFTSLDPTVADMEPLPDSGLRTVPGATLTKAIVIAKGAGTTKIVVAGNGLNDTITTIDYPVSFTGTLTPAAVKVGDTVTVTAPAGITFGSNARIGYATGGRGFVPIISLAPGTLKFVATEATLATVTFTVSGGVLLGTIPLPTLTSVATIAVSADTREPGNNTSAGAIAMGTLAATDSLVAFGEMDDVDIVDYFKFTMGPTGTVSVRLEFAGSGSGAAGNPDYDVVICTTLSATSTCTYTQDLVAGNGASAATQPEAGQTSSIAAGATVYVRLYAYPASAADRSGYRLRVKNP